MNKAPLVSIIIPAYNEERVIEGCFKTLSQQSYPNCEIILVDDGSVDGTVNIAGSFGVKVISQDHKGPGVARNLGVSKSKGEIVVFVDADMEFDKNFIKNLVSPIIRGETIGTFSKEEFVKNKNNPISVCWNINKNLPRERMIGDNFPNEAPVFRAILKDKFLSVGGFDTDGQYIDDWSLSRKLRIKSTCAPGAVYYHTNPQSLKEVWVQAQWIGKNDFIAGSLARKLRSLILYSLPVSIISGLYKSFTQKFPFFLLFKPFYDLAISVAVIETFFGVKKAK